MISFSQALFTELPIIGILRGFTVPQLEQIVSSSLRGGLRNLEVTMNSPDAAAQISRAVTRGANQMNIGAGTVLNLKLLDQALEAGASFIVTPTVQPEVIKECVRLNVPIFPGAMTPTEIVRAHELGATMVKVFPAETLGPAYIRAVKAPLPHIKLLPTGGVDLKTLPAFIKAGADAFGIGSPLFDKKRLESADWDWVEAQCRAFREAFRSATA
jgi:2-dehydro-3-deoxyphosphogluconate aldolase/(4S)-4-hydroxy-2-oxoglutarate aldolase